MQLLTLEFTDRHQEKGDYFYYDRRHFFDALKSLFVNALTASFVFVRAITEVSLTHTYQLTAIEL